MDCVKWVGFRFPARRLSDEEIDIFSPECHKCPLPARVVEAQAPLDEEAAQQPLSEFPNDALKFFCAMHAPIELPDDVFEASILDLYERLKTNVFCPKKQHWKIRVTCIRLQVKCLRKCQPIMSVLGDVPLKLAKEICDKGWEIDKARREAQNKTGEGSL